MELGAFSVSLSVKDLAKSQAFYEHLGFTATGGEPDAGWLIMVNAPAVIGLFQDMFEGNILTFNPGLVLGPDQPEQFTDVRAIQAALVAAGIELGETVADDNAEGPAHITLIDPDGNAVMIDQHR